MSVVVIIDADASERHMLRTLLATLNVEAECFDSAETYLTHRPQLSPICVLTNARLPGMSGLDLLQRLRASKPNLPVILLASDSDVRTAVEAMRLGAMDFIEKPQWDLALMRRIPELLRNRATSPARS